MDFTTDNSTDIIFKEEILPKVIPVLILISFLMLLGVIGNAFVIYIFGFLFTKSTVHFFIVLLAIFDIVCCAFGFPMEIVEFYYSLRYPSTASCKFQRLITFTCSCGSVIMLLAISIERYRKVCRVARSELSWLHRKIFVAVVVSLSFAMASPIVVFSQRRLFIHHRFRNTTTAICSLPFFRNDRFPQYYLIAIFSFISIALVAMLIFYYRVWRTAKKHLMMAHKRREQNDNCACVGPSVPQKQLSRTTRTVIASAVLFALSFFPSLLLTILVLLLPPFLHSFSIEVFYFAVVRLYILNSSFNPVVYGYFNEQFRYETKKMLAKMLRLKEPESLDCSSENNS